jgi:uncharacterized membrane protein
MKMPATMTAPKKARKKKVLRKARTPAARKKRAKRKRAMEARVKIVTGATTGAMMEATTEVTMGAARAAPRTAVGPVVMSNRPRAALVGAVDREGSARPAADKEDMPQDH